MQSVAPYPLRADEANDTGMALMIPGREHGHVESGLCRHDRTEAISACCSAAWARGLIDAVLDHPIAEQPVARRPAVPARLRLLADLRPDAAGQPNAWRLLHARRLFRRDRA